MRSNRPKVEIKPPYAANMRDIYLKTLRDLATAHPSIKLDDWPTFNKLVGGFRTKEYTILCGPTGVGKTSFLCSISAQLLKQKVKHYVASIETGAEDFMRRLMSAYCGRDLNTGDAVPVEVLNRFMHNYGEHFSSDVIEFGLYDNRVAVEQMIADLEYFSLEKGCKVAFIDNLNFMLQVTKASDQIIEMDRVTHELIMFCKRVDIHLVMVMHPKKTDHGRVESEFDIKGSSTSVQEAQNVFLFNPPRPDAIKNNNRDYNDRELRLQKMRRRGFHTGKTIIFGMEGARHIDKGCDESRYIRVVKDESNSN